MEDQEQVKKDTEVFEKDITETSAKLPAGYIKKEFTLNKTEQLLLAEQSTIEFMAQNAQSRIIHELVIKRVGLERNPKFVIRYHVGLGRFVVFMPKEAKKK